MGNLTVNNLISSTINLPGGTLVGVRGENGEIVTNDVCINKLNDKIVVEMKNSKYLKFPVLEMFCSIQGEGMWTGVPSIFVRLAGCNLRCVFGESRCDTPYSSFELEKPKWSNTKEAADEFLKIINQYPNVNHMVITGGEPLLHKNAIKQFITMVSDIRSGLFHTIETNGTLPAIDPWDTEDWDFWIDLWSISPKLSTSVDHDCKYLTEQQRDSHNKTRINIESLRSYIRAVLLARDKHDEYGDENDPMPDYQLKFVYSGEDSVTEIKSILEAIRTIELPYLTKRELNNHVMLMPEGTNNDQLEKISQECAEVCIREGWRFCDRLHIRIWGDKREV